eukprot:SAG11_NODE_692_length_7698_cov_4.143308_2_plen_81_part_00
MSNGELHRGQIKTMHIDHLGGPGSPPRCSGRGFKILHHSHIWVKATDVYQYVAQYSIFSKFCNQSNFSYFWKKKVKGASK